MLKTYRDHEIKQCNFWNNNSIKNYYLESPVGYSCNMCPCVISVECLPSRITSIIWGIIYLIP